MPLFSVKSIFLNRECGRWVYPGETVVLNILKDIKRLVEDNCIDPVSTPLRNVVEMTNKNIQTASLSEPKRRKRR